MHCKVGETTAFDSVQYIMRECPSATCCAVFHRRLVLLHRAPPAHVPRAAVRVVQGAARVAWLNGMAIYLALMAEGFMGYVLPV
jgi:quinol-cytochrome oxidoreductase complex cytochrome b subunit